MKWGFCCENYAKVTFRVSKLKSYSHYEKYVSFYIYKYSFQLATKLYSDLENLNFDFDDDEEEDGGGDIVNTIYFYIIDTSD